VTLPISVVTVSEAKASGRDHEESRLLSEFSALVVTGVDLRTSSTAVLPTLPAVRQIALRVLEAVGLGADTEIFDHYIRDVLLGVLSSMGRQRSINEDDFSPYLLIEML